MRRRQLRSPALRQLFSKIWPGRDDEFSAKMNAMPKLVALGGADPPCQLLEVSIETGHDSGQY